MLEGYITRLIAWTKLKARLHLVVKERVYFKEREIWWISLGTNIGYEQDGKNKNFERPILVLRKFNKHLFLALPLTTKNKLGPYYYHYAHEGAVYSVMLWQLRTMSCKCLLRKIIMMPQMVFNEIRDRVKKLI